MIDFRDTKTQRVALLWAGALVLGFVLCALFFFLAGRQSVEQKEPFAPFVVLQHSAEDSLHTYTGVILVPGCRNLSARYTTAGGPQPSVLVELDIVPQTFCPEEETGERTFSFGTQTESGATPRVGSITLAGVPLQFTIEEEQL